MVRQTYIWIAALVLIFLAVATGIFFLMLYVSDYQAMSKINNFNDCAKQGYPVIDIRPRQCKTPDGRSFAEDSNLSSAPGPNTPGATTTALRNLSIKENALVKSPLALTGEAKGWYFEGSFPIILQDASGTILAQVPGQAQGDWTVADFVPFKATLDFKIPSSVTGFLIFKKDNPSGLPQNDEEFRLPIRFK